MGDVDRVTTDPVRGGLERVDVQVPGAAYPVHIGPGARHLLAAEVARTGATRAVVATARPAGMVPDTGVPTSTFQVRDGERPKGLAEVERLCEAFADAGLTRADVVVSIGGGTTTDVVGLAAALYHRGTAVIHLPTSLLAQVDASVGGKTAVNLAAGKNLVGAFWQPSAVLCDTDFLATLPPREMVNGYGEIARCHFIGAGDLRGLELHRQIAASVALKASVVARDERDQGLRHVLNYGHTLGHAIEIASDFRVRHGEAVGIGTVFAGRLAGALGRIGPGRVLLHREVVESYGLATEVPHDLDVDRLVTLMRRDKKVRGDGLALVLDGPQGPELVQGVDAGLVRQVLTGVQGIAFTVT